MDECTGPAVARCYVRSSMKFSRYPKKHAAWKTRQSWQKYLPGKCDPKRCLNWFGSADSRTSRTSNRGRKGWQRGRRAGAGLSSVPLVRQRDARGTVTYLSERTYDR